MVDKQNWRAQLKEASEQARDWWSDVGPTRTMILTALGIYLLGAVVAGFFWTDEPPAFAVQKEAQTIAARLGVQPAPGVVSTATLIALTEHLLDKPGGYLSNDVFPPGAWLDNIPAWELGALNQIRDFSRAMRRDFGRPENGVDEDPDLAIAEPQFHFDHQSWAIPSSEAEYRRGVRALESYMSRLNAPQDTARFHQRAEDLRRWLMDVEVRLGNLSQRLSASVDAPRLQPISAESVNPQRPDVYAQTPWSEVDDVFFEARGSAWALLHLLQAAEADFHDEWAHKKASQSLRQIILDLEATQVAVRSPVILNGDPFGVFANHSLVMASYISRTHAALKDLNALLAQP